MKDISNVVKETRDGAWYRAYDVDYALLLQRFGSKMQPALVVVVNDNVLSSKLVPQWRVKQPIDIQE